MGAKLWCWLLPFCLPLHHLHLTSPFGPRVHPLTGVERAHLGIDLAARHDTVFAVLEGVVETCRAAPELGLFVRVAHAGGAVSIYGHLSQWLVLPGDTVLAGTPIGITGTTGRVTGEHLHFAVQFQHHYIDPLRFLERMVIPNTIFIQQSIHESTNQPGDRGQADRQNQCR